MPDFGRRIVVAVGALLLIMAQLALIGPAAAAETDPGYLTLLFARAQMRATDGCTPVPGSVSLFEIADELSARGIVASAAVVTNQTSESAETCLDDIGTYASWDQLAGLRDDHSWTMVSTGKAHADITQLTLAGQLEESCGSLEPLEAHGHDRAWGLFGYANDRYTVAIQESTVSTCFAYGRTYASDGTPRNQRAALASPWFQETLSVNGGECNDAASPCYELDGVSRRYMSPQWLGEHMAVGSDEWLVVQTYRFVEGANLDPTSTNQFDCTSPDWRDHWTARPELYCLDDYLGAVDYAVAQGGTGLITTDAATVAEAWGRQRPQQVTDTIPPNGVVEVPAANQVVTSLPVQMSGTATDDTAVGEARVRDQRPRQWTVVPRRRHLGRLPIPTGNPHRPRNHRHQLVVQLDPAAKRFRQLRVRARHRRFRRQHRPNQTMDILHRHHRRCHRYDSSEWGGRGPSRQPGGDVATGPNERHRN